MSLRRLCPQLLIVPLLLAGSPAGQCAAPGAPPAPPRYVAVADFSVPSAMAAAAALAHPYAAPDGTKLPALASETSSAGTPRADAPAAPASGAGWLLPALLGLLGLLLAAAVAYLLYASWRDRKTPGAVSRAFSTALRGLGAGTAAAILAYQAAELVFRQILAHGNFRGTFLSPMLATPSAAAVMLLVFVALAPVFFWLLGMAYRRRRRRAKS